MTRRPGFALVFSLALVLALALLVVGMLAVAAREALIAAAMVRIGVARTTAEAEARRAFERWSTRAHLDLDLGALRALAGAAGADPGTTLTVERVDSTLFLIRAAAPIATGHADGSAAARAALLVQVLDPTAILDAFGAALAADSAAILHGGAVHGEDACGAGRPAMPAVLAPEVEVEPGTELSGDPPVSSGPVPALPPGFALSMPVIGALADRHVPAGEVSPRPRARDGLCMPAPDNWGAVATGHPCEPLLPLVQATGPLHMVSGEARAVLVVDGDLTLSGDAHFEGLLWVRGRLNIEDGAHLLGAARAHQVRVRGGSVRFDGCQVRDAASAPAFDRAFRPPKWWWVAVF